MDFSGNDLHYASPFDGTRRPIVYFTCNLYAEATPRYQGICTHCILDREILRWSGISRSKEHTPDVIFEIDIRGRVMCTLVIHHRIHIYI